MARPARIELGKTPLRFDSATARAATLALQFHVPPAQLTASKLNVRLAAQLIITEDDDAITIFATHGFRYLDRNLQISDMDELFDAYFRAGHRRGEMARPILDALADAGLIELEKSVPDADRAAGDGIPDRPTLHPVTFHRAE